MTNLIFYCFAAMTLAGALLTVTRRNLVHAALSLILSLLGVAGLFLTAKAEFLFAAQILLYVGAVMILFLFVIFLVNVESEQQVRPFSRQWPLAIATLLAILLAGAALFRQGLPLPAPPPRAASAAGNTEQVADVLFYQYALPFEAASLLLLVAILGAVLMTRRRDAALLDAESEETSA
ncbi:MAG: NADH-quinone oxidoreductase subunit J [Bryobacter sp.]|nr:NADH-quinone oxidoreductase subunit J [Bryobacter sp.]